MAKLAFLGLGVMGAPMAGHLAAAGHDVAVYNRTRRKTDAWVERHGGRAAASVAAAADGAEAVFACVGTDDDLAEVTLGKGGAFRAMAPGALFLDHGTSSARIARQLGVEGKDMGLLVLDAPISGGQVRAQEGTLSIMCGGPKKAYEAATPFLQCYGKTIAHIGGSGSGQTAKMVNQIAIAGVLGGLAEAVRFGQIARLDLAKVFGVIGTGAASSWQMVNRWETMSKDEYDFGFAVDWMRKDLGYALDEARSNGATIPVAALVDQFYADIQQLGGGRQDTSSLVRRLPR